MRITQPNSAGMIGRWLRRTGVPSLAVLFLCLLGIVASPALADGDWEIFYEGVVGEGEDEYGVKREPGCYSGVVDFTIDPVSEDIYVYDGQANNIKQINKFGEYCKTIHPSVREHWATEMAVYGGDIFLVHILDNIELKRIAPGGAVEDVPLVKNRALFALTFMGRQGAIPGNYVKPIVVEGKLFLLVKDEDGWFSVPIGYRTHEEKGGWAYYSPKNQESSIIPGVVRPKGLSPVRFSMTTHQIKIIGRKGGKEVSVAGGERLLGIGSDGTIYTNRIRVGTEQMWICGYGFDGALKGTVKTIPLPTDLQGISNRTRFGSDGYVYKIQPTKEKVLIWRAQIH